VLSWNKVLRSYKRPSGYPTRNPEVQILLRIAILEEELEEFILGRENQKSKPRQGAADCKATFRQKPGTVYGKKIIVRIRGSLAYLQLLQRSKLNLNKYKSYGNF